MFGSLYRRTGKRMFDLLLVVPLILASAPVMAVVALLVRTRLGVPVLFRQPRPGRDGATFTLVKFRTMTDARNANGESMPDADRLTTLGRILRATSLDELPELWNVLWGDMSLVGPRPLLTEYLLRYTPEQARRHSVRPGITGLAQVSGRNSLDWESRLRLDVEYADSLSLLMDVKILARTMLTVLRRDGIAAENHATMPEFEGAPSIAARPSTAAECGVVVLGAGGHAKVVIATLQAAGMSVEAILDDEPAKWGRHISGIRITGPIASADGAPCRAAVIAIGDNSLRRRIAGGIRLPWISVVHPAATVHPSVRIGPGTVVCAGAVIQPDTVIGEHVIVNTSAAVDHDCRIGDFTHVAPGATLAGNVHVGSRVLVGMRSAVLPQVRIADDAVIGAGAVVVDDVPAGSVAVGVPARVRFSAGKEAA